LSYTPAKGNVENKKCPQSRQVLRGRI